MKSIKSASAKYGIILGIILSLITVFAYAFMLSLYTKGWFGILMLIIVVAVGVIAAVNSKKLLGGFISFKEAFTSYFIVVLIGTLISTLVAIIIFNFIDPDAAVTLQEMMLDNMRQTLEGFNVPEASISEAIAKASESSMFSLGAKLQQYAINLVVFCVIGLIVALAVRKKDPNAVA